MAGSPSLGRPSLANLGDAAVRAELERIAVDAEVAALWLFGSRARGEATEGSDTDVAVLASPHRAPLSMLELSHLAGRLETVLPAPVETVAFELAPLELRARVVLEGHLLVSLDEASRVRVTVDTQSRWEDVRPALREMDRAYLAAVAAR